MRSTFWPNRIFERHSSQNRETGLKCSWKQENIALSMKIVQNAVFRSCGARFGQIAFFSVKDLKIVKLASNSLQNGKTLRFLRKLYKTLFSGHAQHVLAKSQFRPSKFSKSSHWPEILLKREKSALSIKIVKKRSFQLMRSTFWPNRILERQRSQNRETGLKFSSKQENSALSMKIVQNALFRACAACFGQIAFLTVKVLKILTMAWISIQKAKTVRFSFKLFKTLFSGHAEHVLAKSHFWASISQNRDTGMKISSKRENSALFMNNVKDALFRSCAARLGQIAVLTVKVLKNVTLAWNSFKEGKTVHFSLKLYKTLFSGHAEHVLAQSHFWASISQNRETGLKFSRKRENSGLFMKIVKDALFSSCGARFVQMAFLGINVLKIVTLAWNSCKNGKTVPFPSKSYKTVISGHAQHALAKSHFGASKFSKS